MLVVGIGGSALGPRFVSEALTQGPARDKAQALMTALEMAERGL